jgi:hypothetical protein
LIFLWVLFLNQLTFIPTEFSALIQKITPYIYIVFIYCFSFSSFAQKKESINIKLISNNEAHQKALQKLKFNRLIPNELSQDSIIKTIIPLLTKEGYYTSQIDSVIKNDNSLNIYLDLGPIISNAKILLTNNQTNTLKHINQKTTNNILHLKHSELQYFLKRLTKHLNDKGNTFSKTQIINPRIINDTLTAELSITNNKPRKIDRVIIKGYDEFPKSYISNHLEAINKPFNNSILENVSKSVQKLNFVTEIKKPEVLFSKDSTILFLYLKKKESNVADGLLNFTSENKKLKFRGYIDLKLNNTFNKGEKININWNSFGNQKQNFNSSILIPYIYNSKFSIDIAFDLYKHDSTFTNNNFHFSGSYSFNSRNSLKLIYQNKNSTTQNNSTSIESYKKNHFGLGYNYISKYSSPIYIDFKLLVGKRSNQGSNTNQSQFKITISKEFKLNKTIDLYARNITSKLNSKNTLENELFRVGGPNSIRGFNYQSIFTDSYSLINNELRLTLPNKSKIFSIHDIGMFNINKKNSLLYSLGIGYQIPSKNNLINISFSKGYSNSSFVKNSQIINVNLLSFF